MTTCLVSIFALLGVLLSCARMLFKTRKDRSLERGYTLPGGIYGHHFIILKIILMTVETELFKKKTMAVSNMLVAEEPELLVPASGKHST
jgi:hypothetical protein